MSPAVAARAVRGAPSNCHRRWADDDYPECAGYRLRRRARARSVALARRRGPTNRSMFPIRDGNGHVIAYARRERVDQLIAASPAPISITPEVVSWLPSVAPNG